MTTMDGAFSGFDATRVRSTVPSRETRARFSICISWVAATSVALTIHGGLFWYLTRETAPIQEPAVQEEGAVMIDMAPEVKQAFSETDAAVGQPATEAAETTPPPPPPPEVAKSEMTPPAEESPSEAVAPLPPKPPEPVAEKVPEKPMEKQPEKAIEKPVEKVPPKPKKVVEKPSHKAAAERTAAAPRSEKHDDRTTATSAGVSSNSPVAANWRSQVAAAVNRVKRYPTGAFGAGSPVVLISVSASGAVTGANLVTPSGNVEFDREAVAAVHRVGSFPPPPQGATSFAIRLNFHS